MSAGTSAGSPDSKVQTAASSPNGPEVQTAASPPDDPNLTVLMSDVKRLSEEVAKLKKENTGFWKRVAFALGIIGGLFAVPKASKDAFDAWISRPRTEIRAEVLGMFYDPKSAALVMRVPILITNRGNVDDVLSTPRARVSHTVVSTHTPARTDGLTVDAGGFTFSDKGSLDEETLPLGSSFSMPIAVPKDTPRTIYTSVELDKDFFAQPGEDSIEIEFLGEHSNPYTLKLCFGLDDSLLQELEMKRASTGLRWYYPACK